MSMDKESAWGELMRFALAAEIELDERAEPGYVADPESKDESEVSDYDVLLKALEQGRMIVGDDGILMIMWRKPPREESPSMTMNPNAWPYGRAMRAYSSSTNRKQGEQDNMGKLHRFMEVLSMTNPGTLEMLRSRSDCYLAVSLGNFLISE